MSRMVHRMRLRNHALELDLMVAYRFNTEILDRTKGLIACDGCGKPIVEDEPAAVRITPYGTMFGHTMCLPPMPEQT